MTIKVYIAIHQYTETYCSPYPEEWNREHEIVAVCTTRSAAEDRLTLCPELRSSSKYIVEFELDE